MASYDNLKILGYHAGFQNFVPEGKGGGTLFMFVSFEFTSLLYASLFSDKEGKVTEACEDAGVGCGDKICSCTIS